MALTPPQYKQMKQFLESDQRNKKTALLQDDLEPGPLRDELLKDFDPSQETYEEYLRRKNLERPFNMADGGMLVKPGFGGMRQGYRKDKTGSKQEVEKLLNWIEKNKDTFDFVNSSSADVLKASKVNLAVGTVQRYLAKKGIQTKTAIAKTQDKPKYTKKVLENLREGLPKGISIEQTRPGQYYYKIMLKGVKANQPTYRKSMVANEANKQLIIDDFNRVSKEYYPGRLTDEEFKNLRLANKNMTAEEFAKFLDDQDKTTYLGDKWNKTSVSRTQNRLNIGKGTTGPQTVRTIEEAKKIAKTYPYGKILLRSGASDSDILKFVSNKISADKQALGGKKGFPVGNTKENKMWRNFYNSSLRPDGRMRLLTAVPTDADGNINWKKKDANGVPAWKKAKFFDNKTGATFSWGANYKPGDLARQVDKAYGKGFFAKSVKVYDEQAALNKKTFKGKSLNEFFREGLLKKELEIKLGRILTNSETDKKLLKKFYAIRKPNFSFTEAHHIEGVGPNPFRMEVSYRAANRAQGTLQSKFNSGNITKDEYIKGMENLSDTKGGIRFKTSGRFIGTTATPESIVTVAAKDTGVKSTQIKQIIATLSKDPRCQIRGFKNQGGRVEFQDGSASLDVCFKGGIDNINRGLPNPTAAQARNFGKVAALGRNVVKFGVLPEALFLAGESVIRMGMGDSLPEAILKASEYLLPGNQTKIADRMMLSRTVGPKTAELILKANELRGFETRIENLENEKQFTGILTDDGFDDNFFGQTKVEQENAIQNQINALKNQKKLYGSLTEAQYQFADMQAQEAEDIKTSKALFPKLLAKARSVDIASDDPLAEGIKETINLDLKMLPSRFERQINLDVRDPAYDRLVNTPKQELSNFFKGQELKNILEDKKVIEDYRKETVSEAAALNPEAMFSASTGYFFGEPLDKGVSYTPPPIDTITEMEREITGQTNLNERGEIINPFDIDRPSLATGLRGFAAAGGGIAKLAGKPSGPPPTSGPTSQGLPGLLKRDRRI